MLLPRDYTLRRETNFNARTILQYRLLALIFSQLFQQFSRNKATQPRDNAAQKYQWLNQNSINQQREQQLVEQTAAIFLAAAYLNNVINNTRQASNNLPVYTQATIHRRNTQSAYSQTYNSSRNRRNAYSYLRGVDERANFERLLREKSRIRTASERMTGTPDFDAQAPQEDQQQSRSQEQQSPPRSQEQQNVDRIQGAAKGAEREITSQITNKLTDRLKSINPNVFKNLEAAYQKEHPNSGYVSEQELARYAMENFKENDELRNSYGSDHQVNKLLHDAETAVADAKEQIGKRTTQELNALIAENPEAAKAVMEQFPDNEAAKLRVENEQTRKEGKVIQGEVVQDEQAKAEPSEQVKGDKEEAKPSQVRAEEDRSQQEPVSKEPTASQEKDTPLEGTIMQSDAQSRETTASQENETSQATTVLTGEVVRSTKPNKQEPVAESSGKETVLQGTVLQSSKSKASTNQDRSDQSNDKPILKGEVISKSKQTVSRDKTDSQSSGKSSPTGKDLVLAGKTGRRSPNLDKLADSLQKEKEKSAPDLNKGALGREQTKEEIRAHI